MSHFRFPSPTTAKFMWLAWGGMVWGATQKVPLSAGDMFGELIADASRVARDSRLDLIFVCPAHIDDTVNLSTYRARHDGTDYRWFRYEGGAAIAIAAPPGDNAQWDPFFNFPVHPYELCPRLGLTLYERVFADLAAAIVDAVL